MTPKGHAVFVGVGIEYNWGKSKLRYRRNDLNSKTIHMQVLYSTLSIEVLMIDRIRKYARRARDYERAYFLGATKFDAVEKQRKTFKRTNARWISTRTSSNHLKISRVGIHQHSNMRSQPLTVYLVVTVLMWPTPSH